MNNRDRIFYAVAGAKEKGLTVKEIAEAVKLSQSVIRKWLQYSGNIIKREGHPARYVTYRWQ